MMSVSLASAALTIVLTAAPPPAITGAAIVIDGDTIQIHDTRIRLAGIDALEAAQTCWDKGGHHVFRCGASATVALSNLIGRSPVDCRPSGLDRYGRVLARCFSGGQDLGAAMVRAGWAFVNPQFDTSYLEDEGAARAGGRGAWSSDFMRPWVWRKAK